MPRKVTGSTNTWLKHFVLLCVFVCAQAGHADASSLFGKVIEVNSGDVITVFNLNRPVRVRLLGVDAPEMNQPFGDVAKKHLADLVFDKSVLIEYSGIGPDSSLSGRVLLGSSDIGAQMIRDGVAWMDPSNQHRLTATDREVYQQSEQAARNERRGLWQDENPVAPWEFSKSEALRRIPVASSNEPPSSTKPQRTGPTPELTNLSLMAARVNAVRSSQPAPAAGAVDYSSFVSTGLKNWRVLRPAGEDFTAEVPDDGIEDSEWITFGGEKFEEKTYVAREGRSVFGVGWLTARTYGETDEAAMSGWMNNYLRESDKAQREHTGLPKLKCEPRGQKNVSVNGYTGLEFDMTSCPIPSRVRLYTKVAGEMRHIYMAAVIYFEDDENISRFLNSFAVGLPKKNATRRK